MAVRVHPNQNQTAASLYLTGLTLLIIGVPAFFVGMVSSLMGLMLLSSGRLLAVGPPLVLTISGLGFGGFCAVSAVKLLLRAHMESRTNP